MLQTDVTVCIILDFGYEPHQVFGVNQCFSKHYGCYFHGGYVVGQVLEAYMGQAVSAETDLMVLTGGV